MPAQTRLSELSINDSTVTLNTNTTGEYSAIIDIQVPHGYRYEFPANEHIQMFVYTHEQKTGVSTGTNTVNLSNNLVNSPALRDVPTGVDDSTAQTGAYSLVIWDDDRDQQTGVDAVDYGANTFDYNNQSGNASDLEVFYLWGDSSQAEFRHYLPDEESYEVELSKTMAAFHQASTFSEEEKISFSQPFTMLPKEHLKIALKTDVDLTNWDAYDENQGGGPGNFTTYSYSDFSIPVRRIPMK